MSRAMDTTSSCSYIHQSAHGRCLHRCRCKPTASATRKASSRWILEQKRCNNVPSAVPAIAVRRKVISMFARCFCFHSLGSNARRGMPGTPQSSYLILGGSLSSAPTRCRGSSLRHSEHRGISHRILGQISFNRHTLSHPITSIPIHAQAQTSLFNLLGIHSLAARGRKVLLALP